MLLPLLRFVALDSTGTPVSGARVFVYEAGTLTPKTTYTNAALTIANANPVICDSAGRAQIWLSPGAYRFRVTQPDGTTLLPDGDIDGYVSAIGSLASLPATVTRSGVITATPGQTAFTVSAGYSPGLNALTVVVDGKIVPASDYTETNSTTVTFSTAMVGGEEVEFLIGRLTANGILGEQASITLTGTGAVARTMSAIAGDLPSYQGYTSLQNAVNATDGMLVIPRGVTVTLDAPVNITAPITILGYGAKIETSGHFAAFNISSSNVSILGLEFEGAGNATYNSDGKLITVIGTDNGAGVAPTYIDRINLRDLKMHDAGRCGVFAQFVRRLKVDDCDISDVGYCGVELQSCEDVKVAGGSIKDVSPGTSGNSYGAYASRANVADLVRHPICRHIKFEGIYVENIEWEGLDCHGGDDISFLNNTIINCGDTGAAIAVVHTDNETSTPVYGTNSVRVIGNHIENAQEFGIAATETGLSNILHKGLVISGNSLWNVGSKSFIVERGGIRVGDAETCTVSDNTLEFVAAYGIIISGRYSNNVTVTGNTINRAVSDLVTTPSAILVDRGGSAAGTVSISMNSCKRASTGEAYELVYGVYVTSTDTGDVLIGPNEFDAATTRYSLTAAQAAGRSSPVRNFGNDTIAVTTSVSSASKVITLSNPHSAVTLYTPQAIIFSTTAGNELTLIYASRTDVDEITVTVRTASGGNFAANGNINFYWSTEGF